MKLLRWLLIFALASPLMAQQNNVRWDLPIYTVQASGGNLLPVYAIPGAAVSFYSCSGATCTTLASTYYSASDATACPTTAQVVLNGAAAAPTSCVSNADPYGNMGSWFQPGQYMATITGQGKSYNYYFTVGFGGSSGGVSQIIAGTNISISPLGGTGAVTINSTAIPVGLNNSDALCYDVAATPTVADCAALSLAVIQDSAGDYLSLTNGQGFALEDVNGSLVDTETIASKHGIDVDGLNFTNIGTADSETATPLLLNTYPMYSNSCIEPQTGGTLNPCPYIVLEGTYTWTLPTQTSILTTYPDYAPSLILVNPVASSTATVNVGSGDLFILGNGATATSFTLGYGQSVTLTGGIVSCGATDFCWVVTATNTNSFASLSGNLGTAQGPSSLTGLLYDTAGTLSAATPLQFGQATSDASANMTLDTTRTSAINASDVFQSILVGDGAGHALGTGATGDNVGPNTMVGYKAGYSSDFGVDNVFVGDSSGYNFNGPENSDPADGNNTCVGSTSCYGDKTMQETIALGQKAYVDTNANATGGSADNIFIGIHSDNWDGGSDNILEGYAITRYTGSSSALVTGTGNVLLGAGILSCPSCGSISSPITNNYDTYIGFDAGLEAFNSSYGIGIGYDALSSFTGGSSTASAIAVGHGALQGLTTGISDTAVGDYAANAATTADYISAFGFQACTTDTTANSCTAFGYASGKVTTVAITAFGYESGYSNTSGTNNDTFGSAGGYGITTGIRNVSIGDNSMDHGGAANEDVMIGYDAGYYESSSSNVYIGYTAGGTSSTNTTAGNNVAIGATAFNSSTSSNEYDVAVGSNSTCAGCTSSEMIGYEADVGAVAGAAQIGTGTNSTADTMQFQTLPIASLATFSVSGCGTAGSLTGSGLAGTFTAGATSCAPVITTGVTAPHGFVCDAHDWTTPADTLAQASATTTTATFGTATVTDGDTIAFTCSAY